MSKYKILFKITGSIAAYKSAYLISKLVQNDFEVQTVATRSALNFIGKATLEGLTSRPVLTDQFEDGEMMSHINLMKWADLVILAPASANTINKLANGLADNLVTSLFLAYKFDKPYLIAPAMNSNMYNHPATQSSLEKLKNWGITVLPTDSGYLACGDYGDGKLLDPDKIYFHIIESLNKKNGVNKKILITAGATRERIDDVRFISNFSTGRTAAAIADKLLLKGFDIFFLHGIGSRIPEHKCHTKVFIDFSDLKNSLLNLLGSEHFDFIIHLAAVSDYTINKVEDEDGSLIADKTHKISSEKKSLKIYLKNTEKLVNTLKLSSKNNKIRLIAFKLSGTDRYEDSVKEVQNIIQHSQADFIVLNKISDRENDIQRNFTLFDKMLNTEKASDQNQLKEIILKIIEDDKNDFNS